LAEKKAVCIMGSHHSREKTWNGATTPALSDLIDSKRKGGREKMLVTGKGRGVEKGKRNFYTNSHQS